MQCSGIPIHICFAYCQYDPHLLVRNPRTPSMKVGYGKVWSVPTAAVKNVDARQIEDSSSKTRSQETPSWNTGASMSLELIKHQAPTTSAEKPRIEKSFSSLVPRIVVAPILHRLSCGWRGLSFILVNAYQTLNEVRCLSNQNCVGGSCRTVAVTFTSFDQPWSRLPPFLPPVLRPSRHRHDRWWQRTTSHPRVQ